MAKKILIVDDNLALRQNLDELLTRKGYEVRATGENEEIWRIIKEETCDLMILDLILPDKNTSVILGGLKSACPKMRIVIYSGYEEYENSPYIRQADAFLSKSKGPEVLLSTIEKLLT
jgi:two-component system nitrogen regulation response regulator GlnG